MVQVQPTPPRPSTVSSLMGPSIATKMRAASRPPRTSANSSTVEMYAQSCRPPMPSFEQALTGLLFQQLQGPVVQVIVDSGRNEQMFHLPIALLSRHSRYLKDNIARLMALSKSSEANKKRKFEDENKVAVIKVEEIDIADDAKTKADAADTSSSINAIRLPRVEAFIFGLFLEYVYRGRYSLAIDALPSSASISIDSARQFPFQAISSAANATSNSSKEVSGSTPPKSMPPPPLPCSKVIAPFNLDSINLSDIPPSIRAWLLGSQLQAPSFTNHAIVQIYDGLGRCYQLTPTIVHFIWSSAPPQSALRKLVLDVIITFWSGSPCDRIYVSRNPSLDGEWQTVFELNQDLRQAFIMGSGRVRLAEKTAYFTRLAVPAVVAAGKGVEKWKDDTSETVAENVETGPPPATPVTTGEVPDNRNGMTEV